MTFTHVAILLSYMQLIKEYLLAKKKDFDYSWSLGYSIYGQSRQKVITSWRRNVRCQRPITSWFDLVFLFAFENEHRFENFFSFIIEGIGTLWPFEFELSQNYRYVTAIISHRVSIFLLNASWMTELVKDHWRFGPYTPIFLIPRTLLSSF